MKKKTSTERKIDEILRLIRGGRPRPTRVGIRVVKVERINESW